MSETNFKFNIGNIVLVERVSTSLDPAKEWFNSYWWMKDCEKLVGLKFQIVDRHDYGNENTYGKYYCVVCQLPGFNSINLPEIILRRTKKAKVPKPSKWKKCWKKL